MYLIMFSVNVAVPQVRKDIMTHGSLAINLTKTMVLLSSSHIYLYIYKNTHCTTFIDSVKKDIFGI